MKTLVLWSTFQILQIKDQVLDIQNMWKTVSWAL